MEQYLANHWLDILTTALGLAYIVLEYRVSLWLWVVGFVMQVLDVWLYYDKGLYADCGMEFYYIGMTIYGFLRWRSQGSEAVQHRAITHFPLRWLLPWLVGTLALWAVIWYGLSHFTDSTVPVADAFTTALSFVGIWALARKYLEQWLIWIVVDVVTAVLYFSKELPFKASLYTFYTFIAIAGWWSWRRKMHLSNQ